MAEGRIKAIQTMIHDCTFWSDNGMESPTKPWELKTASVWTHATPKLIDAYNAARSFRPDQRGR